MLIVLSYSYDILALSRCSGHVDDALPKPSCLSEPTVAGASENVGRLWGKVESPTARVPSTTRANRCM